MEGVFAEIGNPRGGQKTSPAPATPANSTMIHAESSGTPLPEGFQEVVVVAGSPDINPRRKAVIHDINSHDL